MKLVKARTATAAPGRLTRLLLIVYVTAFVMVNAVDKAPIVTTATATTIVKPDLSASEPAWAAVWNEKPTLYVNGFSTPVYGWTVPSTDVSVYQRQGANSLVKPAEQGFDRFDASHAYAERYTARKPFSEIYISESLAESVCPDPFGVTKYLADKYPEAFESSKDLLGPKSKNQSNRQKKTNQPDLVTCKFLEKMCEELAEKENLVIHFDAPNDTLQDVYDYLTKAQPEKYKKEGFELWKAGEGVHVVPERGLTLPRGSRRCYPELIRKECGVLTEKHENFLKNADECKNTREPIQTLFNTINSVLEVQCLNTKYMNKEWAIERRKSIVSEQGVLVNQRTGSFTTEETRLVWYNLIDTLKDKNPVCVFVKKTEPEKKDDPIADSWPMRVKNVARPAFARVWNDLFYPSLAPDMIELLVTKAIR